jgi:anti-sigma B factor antagonist
LKEEGSGTIIHPQPLAGCGYKRGIMKNITVSAATHPSHKDVTIISAKGFIDTNTAPEFEQTFQKVLGEKRFNIIIDLKEINYISSAGWGIFISELKRIRGQKGNLFLVSMSPEVTEAFELLEFDTILKAFPDVEQAILKGFGKTLVAKAAAKGKAGKAGKAQAEVIPETAPVEKTVDSPRIAITFDEAPAGKAPTKTPWVFRILLPWKWF